MRRLSARSVASLLGACALASMTACASAGPPPGGPEDHEPPVLITVTPDSGQVNVHPKEVEFQFDETVSGHPSAGVTSLDQLFLISPRNGDVQASWHRGRITVKPEKGFRPNTAYRVTMLPGLADLRGNVRHTGATVVFSTGPTFPAFGIIGRVFDWNLQRPAGGAYVEAISHPDTTVAYVASADTTGAFDIGPLPAGTYTVRALHRSEPQSRDRSQRKVGFDDGRRDDVATLGRTRRDRAGHGSCSIRGRARRRQRDDSRGVRQAARSEHPAAAVAHHDQACRLDGAHGDQGRVGGAVRSRTTGAHHRLTARHRLAAQRRYIRGSPATGACATTSRCGARRAGAGETEVATARPWRGRHVSTRRLHLRSDRPIASRLGGCPISSAGRHEVTRTFTMPKPVPVPRDTTHRTPADSARRPPPRPGRPPNRSELR